MDRLSLGKINSPSLNTLREAVEVTESRLEVGENGVTIKNFEKDDIETIISELRDREQSLQRSSDYEHADYVEKARIKVEDAWYNHKKD